MDYTKAISLSYDRPSTIKYYSSRGIAKVCNGDLESGIRDLHTAVELDPSVAASHRTLGRGYFYKEDYEQAIANYTKAIELETDNANSFEFRAESYEKIGKTNLAEEDLAVMKQLNERQ